MPELRWILLGLGVVFCLGLWWWETRRRGQAANKASDAFREFEEPSFSPAPMHTPPRSRVEPTFGDGPVTTSFDDSALDEPSFDEPFDADEPVPDVEPAPPAAPDRIVSMRLFCAPEQPFEGRELIDAMLAEGLEHGQFSIFHKHDDDGRRLFSVASLLEPGSFDLDAIDGVHFKGVVFFAVQKEAGEEGLADMRRTAQAMAGRLNGNLTAER